MISKLYEVAMTSNIRVASHVWQMSMWKKLIFWPPLRINLGNKLYGKMHLQKWHLHHMWNRAKEDADKGKPVRDYLFWRCVWLALLRRLKKRVLLKLDSTQSHWLVAVLGLMSPSEVAREFPRRECVCILEKLSPQNLNALCQKERQRSATVMCLVLKHDLCRLQGLPCCI